jgi:hypothetical protein
VRRRAPRLAEERDGEGACCDMCELKCGETKCQYFESQRVIIP